MNHFALYLEHCKSVIPRLKKYEEKKKKESLVHATTFMNLKDTILIEKKNKPVTKGQIVYHSPHMKYLK